MLARGVWVGGVLAALSGSALHGGGCVADLDGSGIVDGGDLGLLISQFGLAKTGDPADLDENGAIDGGDLGVLLSAWGPCPPECLAFSSFKLLGESVGAPNDPFPTSVLTGNIRITPEGEPQGLIIVSHADGSTELVEMALATTTVYVDASVVSLVSASPPAEVTIDAQTFTVAVLLDGYYDDLASGLPPSLWSVGSRALLALTALVNTQPYCCNLQASLEIASTPASLFWCKTGTASVCAALVAQLPESCLEIEWCDGPVAVGDLDLPCASLQGICLFGDYAGGEPVFDAILGVWLGQ